jgi:phospholipid-binding lipoprotein MlaA
VFISLLSSILFACSTVSPATVDTESTSDPLEPFNRAIWQFNYEILDKPIYRPVSRQYLKVPYGVRLALKNFVGNLDEPSSFVNHLLQFKIKEACGNLMRFSMNSTFGLLGMIDIMGKAGLPQETEEFADVLGFYGVGMGPYLMAPVAGPYTMREAIGSIVDNLYFPFSDLSVFESAIIWGVDGVRKRASVIDQEGLLDDSIDSYSFLRGAYVQYRRFRFYNGNPPELQEHQSFETEDPTNLDDFLDEIEGF